MEYKNTWLMSCRVLGRRVEEAILKTIAEAAKRRGIERLIGTYITTHKNEMVRDHYTKLGFSLVDESPEARVFELVLSNFDSPPLPFKAINGDAGQR